jgi:hypothetical protein
MMAMVSKLGQQRLNFSPYIIDFSPKKGDIGPKSTLYWSSFYLILES